MRLSCRLKRHGSCDAVEATTVNLGRLGALVVTGKPVHFTTKLILRPGDPVLLEVTLPAHQSFGRRCLSCDAVAVRCANQDEISVVALQFQRVEIRTLLADSPPTRRVEVM
ncbi:MAG TPA: hypothetical protein VMH05_14750 [Bryobacteraceae bacterium]|nr:hypothetical protein [Bryobacteraceae bacterium]